MDTRPFCFMQKYFTARYIFAPFFMWRILGSFRRVWQFLISMNFITNDIGTPIHLMCVGWVKIVALNLQEINRPVSRICSWEPPLLNTQRLWIKNEAGREAGRRGETEKWRKKVYKKDPSVGSCGMRCWFTCIKLVGCPGRAQWRKAEQQVRIKHKPSPPSSDPAS